MKHAAHGKKGKAKMPDKEYERHKKATKPHRGVMSVLKAMRGKK